MSLDGLDSPRLDEKDRWLRHWGGGSPRGSVGRFGSSVCFGSVGLLARGLMRVRTRAARTEKFWKN